MTPETRLKNKVREYFESLTNCFFYKVSDRYEVGLPDFIICYRGQFLGIELKAKSKQSKIQKHKESKIIMAGGIAKVCYSVDQVRTVIELIDKLTGGPIIGGLMP